MDLSTRCPHCATTFKVRPAELQLRKGYLRCINCAAIFDAYAEVVPDEGAASAPAAAPQPPQPPPKQQQSQTSQSQLPQSQQQSRPQSQQPAAASGADAAPHVLRSARVLRAVEPRGEDGDAADGAQPFVGRGAADRAPGVASEPQIGAGLVAVRPDKAAQPGGFAEPLIIEPRAGHRPDSGSAAELLRDPDDPGLLYLLGRGLAWLVLSALLLLFLAQAAYVYRASIAQAMPQYRQLLERACLSLRCEVPYLRDLALIDVKSSDLRLAPVAASGAGDAQPGNLLVFALRNRANYPQQWPSVALELVDVAGALQVRRLIAPHEYLAAGFAEPAFAAGSEILVRLPFGLRDVQINGYKLSLVYP